MALKYAFVNYAKQAVYLGMVEPDQDEREKRRYVPW